MIIKLIAKVINIIFVLLGVVFLLIILAVSYIWVVDPWHLKLDGVTISGIVKTTTGEILPVDNIDKNPLLNEEQEATLETLGVDPATLPTEISPALQKCFTTKLGEARTTQIINGDSLTATDYFKASSCLNK